MLSGWAVNGSAPVAHAGSVDHPTQTLIRLRSRTVFTSDSGLDMPVTSVYGFLAGIAVQIASAMAAMPASPGWIATPSCEIVRSDRA